MRHFLLINCFNVMLVILAITGTAHGVTGQKNASTPLAIHKIDFTPLGSLTVLRNTKVRRTLTIRPNRKKAFTIRILGKRRGMYVISIFKNGKKMRGTFLISKKWAHRGLNINAAIYAAKLSKIAAEAGKAPGKTTCGPLDNEEKEAVADPNVAAVEMAELPGEKEDEIIYESNKTFKPGCEVLANKVAVADKEKLKQCILNIKKTITKGTRDKYGRIQRGYMFCNMYKKLRPEEQEFAGLIFTSAGEAGIISGQRSTKSPKHKEQLYVMKVLENRTRQARADYPEYKNLNPLDASLAHNQFSMYNGGIFKNFRSLFEPRSAEYNTHVGHSIDAFIDLKNDAKFEPKDKADRVDMYFNPHGMAKTKSSRALINAQKLAREGRVPNPYPGGRVAPRWDFDKIDMVEDFSVNGVQSSRTKPYMHVFYARNKGRKVYYGSKKYFPPAGRKQCDN